MKLYKLKSIHILGTTVCHPRLNKSRSRRAGRKMDRTQYIFFACVGIITTGQFASNLYIPSLPAISEDMKASFGNAQLTVSSYMLGYFISELILGFASDFLGRKKTTIIGFCICIAGSLACFSSKDIVFLIYSRLLQGLGGGVALSVSLAIMRDVFSGKTLAKYVSYLSMFGTIAIASGPFIGGYIQEILNWRDCFLFLILYSGSVLVFIIFKLPETNTANKIYHSQHNCPSFRPPSITRILKSFSSIFQHRYFIGGSISMFVIYSAMLCWLTSGSILFQQSFGLTPAGFGFVTLIYGLAFGIGCIFNAQLTGKYNILTLIKTGAYMTISISFVMFLISLTRPHNVYFVSTPIIAFGFAASFIFSNIRAVVTTEFPDTAGICAALLGGFQVLGGIISSFIVSRISNNTPLTIAIVFLVCSCILFLSTRIFLFKTP